MIWMRGAVYPPDVFITQLQKVADGFDQALRDLALAAVPQATPSSFNPTLRTEMRLAEAAAIHCRSTANQGRFVLLRRALQTAKSGMEARPLLNAVKQILNEEIALARRLYELQSQDSRIGFEASNQYYYVPVDLLEKIVNCADLRDRWLPSQRARFGPG